MAYAVHEPIGRTIQLAAPMRIEDVVLRQNEAYPDLPPTFHCRPLLADISAASCKTNFLAHKGVSCRGCAVGLMHASVKSHTAIDVLNDESLNRHERALAKNSLPCIRCEKSSKTNARLQGFMRLTRRGTVCVSCFNRQSEFEKRANSKGGMPRLVLKPASVTIEKDGVRSTLDIGLRMNWHECGRYVERIHAGATVIKIVFDGETIQQYSLWTPLPFSPWEPASEVQRSPRFEPVTAAQPEQRDDSIAISPAWREVFSDLSEAPKQRKPRKQRKGERERREDRPDVEAAARAAFFARNTIDEFDTESIAGYWDGMHADGLPDFIAWLCEDWPAFAIGPAAPSAPLIEPSEWEGCYVVRDGVTTYATDYGRERGISDEAAAIELGLCDPDYEDEPAPAPVAEPEAAPAPVKAARQPEPKKLTGKQQRKLEKAQRRAERQQQQRPSNPSPIAVTARAYMKVLFEIGHKR